MCKQRITMIIGAGAPLDFDLPKNIVKPSTTNITNEVIKPYEVFCQPEGTTKSSVVKDIYDLLVKKYPPTPQQSYDWKSADEQKPYIHFEILFHVIEMYLAYKPAWVNNCKNGDIFPYFALFSNDAVNYSYEELLKIKRDFIVRIMDLVAQYDEYYKGNKDDKEKWYADFFKLFKNRSDIFNFNYDTTIEESLGEFEDGFEDAPDKEGLKIFNPNRLWKNKQNLSTVNHIHGCILYFQSNNDDNRYNFNMLHDMFKYKDYPSMRARYIGTGHSEPVGQDHTEYIAGPIITGLRKTEKLNCIPYDFYHGNLYNSVINNSSLIISGYSFGDNYTNQLLFRMGLLHGNATRVVLIDFWDEKLITEYGLDYFLTTKVSNDLITFLLMTSEIDTIGQFCKELDKTSPNYYLTRNGRMMIFTKGFKHAAKYRKEIKSFVDSNKCCLLNSRKSL